MPPFSKDLMIFNFVSFNNFVSSLNTSMSTPLHSSMPKSTVACLSSINISFCNYISSFNKEFDESPEPLNNALKYSNQLTDDFTKFYQQFNLLTEEALKKEDNPKQNQKNSGPNRIIIDNMIVKQLSYSIKNNIDKLKKKNEETNNTIKMYDNELSKMLENKSA